MLTAKQQRFVAEYLIDSNAAQAAIRAGYSAKVAETNGPRLLRNAQVAAAVAEARKAQLERLELRADDVIRELMRVALCDIADVFDDEGRLKPLKEIPVNARRAMAGIDVEELWETDEDGRRRIGDIRKVRFWEKTKALEQLGRHLKLFTDKIEVTGDGFADLLKEARTRAQRGK